MKNILCIIFTIYSLHSFGQNHNFNKYHQYKELAHFSDSIGLFSQASAYYDTMLTFFEYHPFDYYDAFISAYNDSNIVKAKEYLIKGASKGLDISYFFGDKLNHFLSTTSGIAYLEIKDSILKEHYKIIDTISYNILDSLVTIDQQFRNISIEMSYNDSLNFVSLIKLSKERGFPTFPTTGYGCNKAWLLLWHHRGKEFPNSLQWQQIIPYIEKEIGNGKLDPDFLKMFYNSKAP